MFQSSSRGDGEKERRGRTAALLTVIVAKAVVALVLMGQSAAAAEFTHEIFSYGKDLDAIEVRGDLEPGDEYKFIDATTNRSRAIVIFHSPGGNLVAGIEIGKAIRFKGFFTLVPDSNLCASACALAWLGGRVRLMSPTGRIGFHAAYSKEGGRSSVSSAGNAIVGAYLNHLGLSTPAIVYITSAPPDEVTWLSFAEARRVGIDVKEMSVVVDSGPAASSSAEPNAEREGVVDVVGKETLTMIEANNRPNAEALAYLRTKYADNVNYFGNVLPKGTVLNAKAAFFSKWPGRKYFVRGGSVRVACSTQTKCRAEFSASRELSGAMLKSTDSGTFVYDWTIQDGNWLVDAEFKR